MRLSFRLIPLWRHSCCRPGNAVAPWTTLILLPRHQLCIMHAKVCGLKLRVSPGYNTKYRFILSYVCRCVARASEMGGGRKGGRVDRGAFL